MFVYTTAWLKGKNISGPRGSLSLQNLHYTLGYQSDIHIFKNGEYCDWLLKLSDARSEETFLWPFRKVFLHLIPNETTEVTAATYMIMAYWISCHFPKFSWVSFKSLIIRGPGWECNGTTSRKQQNVSWGERWCIYLLKPLKSDILKYHSTAKKDNCHKVKKKKMLLHIKCLVTTFWH